jgi:CRISPR/Cas system-associated exonuclease Cas4 (RecB family)
LGSPYRSAKKIIDKITLRGYESEEVFLTGEIAQRIKEQKVSPLSVSDIADALCPTRRDLYFKKGINKPTGIKTTPRWGRKAGQLVEKYLYESFDECCKIKRTKSYRGIHRRLDIFSKKFFSNNNSTFSELERLRTRPEEDPTWLINLLNLNGRAELGLSFLHSILSKSGNNELDIQDIETNKANLLEINPKPVQIGINKGSRPDFRVSKLGIIGDIKSGTGGFQDRYLLTCTGYALANENELGKAGDINFGIIYLLPTRHSEYIRPISFAQIYIFPINDRLRQWFIDMRNQAYEVISQESIPPFPDASKIKECGLHCKYFDYCISQGLVYE